MGKAQRLAPTAADDLQIKWHCALNEVPVAVLNPEACSSDFKSFPLVSYEEADRDNSLYKYLEISAVGKFSAISSFIETLHGKKQNLKHFKFLTAFNTYSNAIKMRFIDVSNYLDELKLFNCGMEK